LGFSLASSALSSCSLTLAALVRFFGFSTSSSVLASALAFFVALARFLGFSSSSLSSSPWGLGRFACFFWAGFLAGPETSFLGR